MIDLSQPSDRMHAIIPSTFNGKLLLLQGWMGPNYSISTACATSNFCILSAANHIIRGEAVSHPLVNTLLSCACSSIFKAVDIAVGMVDVFLLYKALGSSI